MKYIQNFRDKVVEWNKLKAKQEKLIGELSDEVKDFTNIIVGILDELMLKNGTFSSIEININVKVVKNGITKTYNKIRQTKRDIDSNHSLGIETIVHWGRLQSDRLWNFTSGGRQQFEDIADIADFLIKEYPEEYELFLMKKSANKYNI